MLLIWSYAYAQSHLWETFLVVIWEKESDTHCLLINRNLLKGSLYNTFLNLFNELLIKRDNSTPYTGLKDTICPAVLVFHQQSSQHALEQAEMRGTFAIGHSHYIVNCGSCGNVRNDQCSTIVYPWIYHHWEVKCEAISHEGVSPSD